MENLKLPSSGDPFIRRIGLATRANELVRAGDAVLLAVSGGADSTALAVVFRVLARELSLSLHIAHVDHCLRAEASQADAGWVRELAAKLEIPFHLAVLDVRSLHERVGGSLEEVARDARYGALREFAAATGSASIATAHHRDDQAETVMLHILRGAGLDGLGGIERRSSAGVIRPFLDVTGDEIRAALRRWRIGWREDATNTSLTMARNRVRHVLLPYIEKEWNPRFRDALARVADLAKVDDAALEGQVKEAYPQVIRQTSPELILLDIKGLQSYPLGIRRRLIRRAAHSLRSVKNPLSYAETLAVEALVGTSKQVAFRGRLRVWATRSHLAFEAADAWQGPTLLSIDGDTLIGEQGRLRVRSNGSVLDRTVLFARRWKPGDSVVVRGRTRLVADVLRNLKPHGDPRIAVLVVESSNVLWVSALGDSLAADPCLGSGMCFEWEPSA
jgi:tRNA(Ile)-lysidine synthase